MRPLAGEAVPRQSSPEDPHERSRKEAAATGDGPIGSQAALGAGPRSARDAPAWLSIRQGVVSSFDDHRGLGEITSAAGETVPFHCTAIADASRSIPVGAPVAFLLVPGHLGADEAGAVAPLVLGVP